MTITNCIFTGGQFSFPFLFDMFPCGDDVTQLIETIDHVIFVDGNASHGQFTLIDGTIYTWNTDAFVFQTIEDRIIYYEFVAYDKEIKNYIYETNTY